jgi:hypothetical protein
LAKGGARRLFQLRQKAEIVSISQANEAAKLAEGKLTFPQASTYTKMNLSTGFSMIDYNYVTLALPYPGMPFVNSGKLSYFSSILHNC